MTAMGVGVVGGMVAGTATATTDTEMGYEVWALDQGTNTAHILGAFDETTGFDELDRIEDLPDSPHMIAFSSDDAYAFIASTAGSAVTVVRTADREIVATFGAGGDVDLDVGTAHYAGITPDDRTIHVDDLHHGAIHVFDADLETETFSHRVTLDLSELLAGAGYPSTKPVCHDYTSDGRYAYVTLGPGFADGGLFVLDVETNEVVETYDPDRIRTNCGSIVHPDLPRMYLNGGGGLDDDSVWYTFDTASHTPLPRRGEERDSRGAGAHGVMLTPDNRELWMVNRVTNDGIVIDTRTDEVIAEIDQIGPASMGNASGDRPPYAPTYDSLEAAPANPGDKADIFDVSPDGAYMFCTLRGLNPRSAGSVSVGENPGVAVLSVADRERVSGVLDDGVWKPGGVGPLVSDFHGIGVRKL